MEIGEYTPDLERSVRAFNQRLRAGGEERWRFPECHEPRFPKQQDRNPYQEFFLALHAGEVRGGYLLTHNQFAIRRKIAWVTCGPQVNLSEGIVDPAYSMVGVILAQDALRRHPLMYALGMGGMDEPLTKLLVAMAWQAFPVPFHFRVVSASRFCENISYLRRRPAACVALDLLRYSGIGSLGFRLAQARPAAFSRGFPATRVQEFGPWADALWDTCKDAYSFIALRNRDTLNVLYPPGDARFHRLRIAHADRDLGWAVVLDTQMSGHRQFGSMRVGSIVDCLALPENAAAVVRAATRFLEMQGVDIIVSNQASKAWNKALARNGYINGPSNFILALSPELTKELQPLEEYEPHIHINRGDGDGPINL